MHFKFLVDILLGKLHPISIKELSLIRSQESEGNFPFNERIDDVLVCIAIRSNEIVGLTNVLACVVLLHRLDLLLWSLQKQGPTLSSFAHQLQS